MLFSQNMITSLENNLPYLGGELTTCRARLLGLRIATCPNIEASVISTGIAAPVKAFNLHMALSYSGIS